MKRLWAVSSGEYSYYSVIAVFGDEADAKAVAAALNHEEDKYNDKAFVEELDYYPAGEQPIVTTIWTASISPGYAAEREIEVRVSTTTDPEAPGKFRRPKTSFHEHREHNRASFSAACVDREAAVKSVNDRWMRWKAEAPLREQPS